MPKHQSQIHRPKGSHVSYEVASARRNENLPAHDLVFHIFHNSSTIARRCDRSPVSLKIFILFSCGKNIQVENEQPTAENYEGFVNKLYLIQPQASQINVRHVGSSTYGNHDHLLRSEVFRKLTNFTDEKIHAKVCYYYTEQWGGALRDDTNNGCVAV